MDGVKRGHRVIEPSRVEWFEIEETGWDENYKYCSGH